MVFITFFQKYLQTSDSLNEYGLTDTLINIQVKKLKSIDFKYLILLELEIVFKEIEN